MDKRIILLILFGIIVTLLSTSCRYTRPIFSWRVFKDETQDTITKNTIKTKYYNYISLRKFAWLGGYTLDREYDTNGTLIKQGQFKKTPLNMCDGHVRYYYRAKYFDQNKNIIQIYYRITQCKGRGSIRLVDKNVYYEKGEKVRPIDNDNK
jgi:hypothetical protein